MTTAIPGRTRTKEARKCAIKQTFFLTYLLLDARRQRVRRYRRTTQTPAGKQAGRMAGREEAKAIQYCRSQVQKWRRNTGQKLKPIVPGPRRKCNI
jgi:hypothetical protein